MRIAAFKSAGVPVIWVGLPSQRGTNASNELSYLNELYRSEAEKAGIVYSLGPRAARTSASVLRRR
jgi:hypothetical protein